MKQLKKMKETLITAVQAQLTDLHNANTGELGCAIDMIKDLSEAIYYCSITKAMEDAEEKEEKNGNGNGMAMMHTYYPERDQDMSNHRMYYPEREIPYYDKPVCSEVWRQEEQAKRDMREGRSPTRRKSYMESRKSNGDRSVHLKELEQYIQELGADITEMIQGASPEEKQLLQKKLALLANKIQDS